MYVPPPRNAMMYQTRGGRIGMEIFSWIWMTQATGLFTWWVPYFLFLALTFD